MMNISFNIEGEVLDGQVFYTLVITVDGGRPIRIPLGDGFGPQEQPGTE